MGSVKARTAIQRFFLPAPIVTIVYYFKYKCKISPRAEVELSSLLTVGRDTQISSFCKVKATNGPLVIGSDVSVGSGSFISSDKMGVRIGDHCLIGPNVTITGNNYRYDRLDVPICKQGTTSKGIKIGSDVWIGAGACILDGADIGNGVIVTPNSVVSTKVPDNSVVQGNPAKAIFMRSWYSDNPCGQTDSAP